MVGMRARTGAGVAQLSAFAQSTGYLISIPGPLLVGVLYQHSGGWGLPIALMAGLMVPQMIVGVLAGRAARWRRRRGRSESGVRRRVAGAPRVRRGVPVAYAFQLGARAPSARAGPWAGRAVPRAPSGAGPWG
ncbi:hypothetical protein SALBM217S_09982 [Streptomyces griseoloalbus]